MKKRMFLIAVIVLLAPTIACAESWFENVLTAVFTPPFKLAALVVQVPARVIDEGGSPLRWVNSAVRQTKESTLDAAEGVVRIPLSLGGVEPIEIKDEVGEVTQAIRDGGPVAEAVTDVLFVGAVTGVLQNNRPDILGYGHVHKWEKAVMVGAAVSGASQVIDPTSEDGGNGEHYATHRARVKKTFTAKSFHKHSSKTD